MSNPFSYAGKRVVLTGGATGVGAALLDLLAEIGAPEVTVLDLKPPTGPHAKYIATNLSERGAVDNAIAELDGKFDVLFNNAGVAATQAPQIVMAVNYLALRKLSEQLVDKINPGGAIVNTASIAGGQWASHLAEINELIDIGDWDKSLEWVDENLEKVGGDSYSFSKEVVRVYGMRTAKATLAKGVRTNSVCPAPIDTPLLNDFKATIGQNLLDFATDNGTGKAMTPREVAMPLAFLGSEAAIYINGHDLVADGGFTANMTTGQVDFSKLG
jgi:NAD(P)-dependent dehydrogenase (short-subunit alcohol dehydrogenase family)